MPTVHKRHSVTETPAVAAALAPLRARGEKVVLSELVVLGAQEKLRRIAPDAPEVVEARQWLAARVRGGEPLADVDAADAVRKHGWARG